MIPTVPSTKEPVLVEKQRQQERRIAILHLSYTMLSKIQQYGDNYCFYHRSSKSLAGVRRSLCYFRRISLTKDIMKTLEQSFLAYICFQDLFGSRTRRSNLRVGFRPRHPRSPAGVATKASSTSSRHSNAPGQLRKRPPRPNTSTLVAFSDVWQCISPYNPIQSSYFPQPLAMKEDCCRSGAVRVYKAQLALRWTAA